MACTRDRCRCCFSSETLETLQSPILEVLKLICNPQDVNIDNYPTEACFKCHNFLKDVHRFRKKCLSVYEIFRNNLQDVKHEVDLILKNADCDGEFSFVCVKKELITENEETDQIDVQINKVEADYESTCTRDGYELYPEVPFVSFNENDDNHSNSSLDPIKDNLSIELKEEKVSRPDKRNKNKKMKQSTRTKSGGITKRPRKAHKKKHHTDKPFECDECSYKCTRPSNLKIHQRTHSGERPYSCKLCPYTCSIQYSIKIHMRNKHSDERPHSCDQCDYRAKTRNALVMHKKQHSNVRDFMCELCPYGSVSLINLKNHIRSTHTGEKPYICDRCPYRTTDSGTLKVHLKSHDKHKKFSCNECSFASNRMSNLKAHITKHTGELRYACDLCDTKFTYPNSLRRHLKKQHGKVFETR